MPLAILAAIALHCGVLEPTAEPQSDKPMTRWGRQLDPKNVLPEYPRPQMARKDWINLNGTWDYAIADAQGQPTSTGKIVVPFPIESKLSGVGRQVPDGHALIYRRTFRRPSGSRVLIHFGAVDWSTTVLVNGEPVGHHEGGYDPFSFDITEALKGDGEQELLVTVSDPTDKGPQPRGKQVVKPGGIFYTPATGIWQTVWMEGLSSTYVDDLDIHTDTKTGTVSVTPRLEGAKEGVKATLEVLQAGKLLGSSSGKGGEAVAVKVDKPTLWSPESPHLYDLRVTLRNGTGAVIDSVDSYCAFRDIALIKSKSGQPMVALNGKPLFLFGPLDQGFWPDGIYTAPSDEALKFDIQAMKDLGFNTIRKHVKVEPQRWYTWCDRMGILVMQDMPSGDGFISPTDPDLKRTPESKEIYYRELTAMMDSLKNHPSIVCWVPFNEGWGQFETSPVTDFIRKKDPTRLIDSTTGWTDRGVGDFHDVHVYPGPGAPKPETGRASLLGEFGGLGLVVEGHTWLKDGWGYQSYKTKEELTVAIENLCFQLRLLRATSGLSGAIYTQTTDVETELNGLLTYDRELVKPDEARLKAAIMSVYKSPPVQQTLVPTSESSAQTWAMTTQNPGEGWQLPSFNDKAWTRSKGGFGTAGTPGAVIGTVWDGDDIWLRRQIHVAVACPVGQGYVRIHHDEDAEVFLDGALVATLKGYTGSYTLVKLPVGIKVGGHVLAVHCHQTTGGQFIDVGLVHIKE